MGRPNAPSGTFTAVAASEGHSCGLRTDNTIECWGANRFGPGGRALWDLQRRRRRREPLVRHPHRQHHRLLGLRRRQRTDQPTQRNLHRRRLRPCPLVRHPHRQDHHLLGPQRRRQAPRQPGTDTTEPITISAGRWHAAVSVTNAGACRLRTDGTITCWVWDSGERVNRVSRSEAQCGRRPYGPCYDDYTQFDAPSGQFTAVHIGNHDELFAACGLRTDGTATCWSWLHLDYDPLRYKDRGYFLSQETPNGTFIALTVYSNGACGIRTDGTVECWRIGGIGFGPSDRSQYFAHGERFASLIVGGRSGACGLRADGTVTCVDTIEDEAYELSGQFTPLVRRPVRAAPKRHRQMLGFRKLLRRPLLIAGRRAGRAVHRPVR